MPAENEIDISAPNTATASAPPVCLAALNSPPASPAWAAGSESSSTNVSDGSANPSPAPAGTSAISTPVLPRRNTSRTIPSVLVLSPRRSGSWCPHRADARAEARLATVSRPVIGRKSRPAVTGGSPSTRWKYRLSTKTMP